MNDARFKEIPLILETPAPEKDVERVYRDEIDLLYSLASNVKK